MGVYQEKRNGRKTGTWVAEVVVKGKRYRERFPSHAEAEAQVRSWKLNGVEQAKKATDTERLRLSQALDAAADILWARESWRALILSGTGRLIMHLGDPYPDGLPNPTRFREEVTRWARKEKLSPSSVNKYLGGLSKLLGWCHGRGMVAEVPRMPWVKEPKGRIRWLTPEEEARLLDTLRGYGHPVADEVADFFRVSILTACRRRELLTARPEQVDGRWLRLWDTKTGDPRSVPLNAEAQAILARRLPWGINPRQIRYWWLKVKADLVLGEELTPHVTRHTAATRLLRETRSLKIVQRYLGHKRITTTERYAHLHDDDLLEAADRLA